MSQTSTPPQDSSVHQFLSLEDKYDFVITADGSGHHADSVGAWAVIVTSKQYPQCKRITAVGCSSHTTVPRAELQAIIEGLHIIANILRIDTSKSVQNQFGIIMPTVRIVSDHLNHVNAINDAMKYAPDAHVDLWQQFSWYTNYFEITAQHIPGHKHLREEHDRVDCLASLGRVVLCDFINIQKEVKHIRDEQSTTTDKTNN